MPSQTAPATTEINQLQLRNAFGQFATGVTVITTVDTDGSLIGMTANSFTSVSMDPPLLLCCPGNNVPSLPAFQRAGHFTINVLAAEQQNLALQFARPADDKFAGVDYTPGLFGAPVLADALATFECTIYSLQEMGDHHLMVGEIHRFTSAEDGAPLLFHQGRLSAA